MKWNPESRILEDASDKFYCMSLCWEKGLSSCIRATHLYTKFHHQRKYFSCPCNWFLIKKGLSLTRLRHLSFEYIFGIYYSYIVAYFSRNFCSNATVYGLHTAIYGPTLEKNRFLSLIGYPISPKNQNLNDTKK